MNSEEERGRYEILDHNNRHWEIDLINQLICQPHPELASTAMTVVLMDYTMRWLLINPQYCDQAHNVAKLLREHTLSKCTRSQMVNDINNR